MESLISYIPTDRRMALAHGQELPERSAGTALFADISGFTPLTEMLVQALGPQRGAEELPRLLNLVYDAVIAEIDRCGGSVIAFSGDAVTCWFAESSSAAPAGDHTSVPSSTFRATACALAIQQAMQAFSNVQIPGAGTSSLAIKVAVASGSARRFVVGDPQIQLVDALGGVVLDRLATAEHHAQRGDIVLDQATAEGLGEQANIRAWRVDEQSGERFAFLAALYSPVAPTPWPLLEPQAVSDEQARPWLLPAVYERLRGGLGEFLTELRPAVALFLRFGGIDYDEDEQASSKLDAYIIWVEQVLRRYGGSLLQLTIGDKGSYFYAVFGTPLAHEDDAARAVAAALELRTPLPEFSYVTGVQIGISQGRMRTGAYGGTTRRTYGVLGDDVNMAARLMQHAAPGEVYVSANVRKSTADRFIWWTLPPLTVKGKSQPVSVFRLLAAQERRTIRLQAPRYTLPMIGRADEFARIAELLQRASMGAGQIVGISAEAGVGKSRLVAEIIRLAQNQEAIAIGGECQSYGNNTSYLVWQNIWRGFFGLDPAWTPEQQVAGLASELEQIDPALLPRLPLLGAVLNMAIPDNDLTSGFDAKLRKASLEALLVDCLLARAADTPLLIVLEDCHWLDPLSHDLLEVIARAIVSSPILILMAYRPPQIERLMAPRVTRMAHFTEVPLGNLAPSEVEDLLCGKLAHLYGADVEAPPALIEQISMRAQGNPFYVEELLNYLHDREIDPRDPQAVQIDLPASLHSLILSRIDQLSENQKTLLKVASVIGRLFRAAMLWGVYTFSVDSDRVRADLNTLSELDLTPLDTPDPELAYLFKHVVTQEVTYESMPYATRAVLHDQIGQYIERAYADVIDQQLDLLAYHYGRSRNDAKQREFLRRAGQAAQSDYANLAAISYYDQLLPLLSAAERGAVLFRLGQVKETLGRWDEALEHYRDALALAIATSELAVQLQCRIAIGEMQRRQGQFAEAGSWYERARHQAEQQGDQASLAKALICEGTLAVQQGSYELALARYDASLVIRRALDDQPNIANLLNNMSIIASYVGDLDRARALQEESLAIRRALGNKWAIANSLNNLGMFATDQGELRLARASLEEAIALQREIGDPSALATSLHSLANTLRAQAEYQQAKMLYVECLQINRQLGDRWMLIQLLEDVGWLAALQGAYQQALRLVGAAATARAELGSPLPPAEQAKLDLALAPARSALAESAHSAWQAGQALELPQAVALALE